jgi:hypothetical protein
MLLSHPGPWACSSSILPGAPISQRKTMAIKRAASDRCRLYASITMFVHVCSMLVILRRQVSCHPPTKKNNSMELVKVPGSNSHVFGSLTHFSQPTSPALPRRESYALHPKAFKLVWYLVVNDRGLLPQTYLPRPLSIHHLLASLMVNFSDPAVIENDLCAHAF